MSESLFLPDGELFMPTEHARGPWDPQSLHGGAPAALITDAFERSGEDSHLRIARLGFELLRPVPMAPLELSVSNVRRGRRVNELAAELHSEGRLICRAGALLVSAVPGDLPSDALSVEDPAQAMPPPSQGRGTGFALEVPVGIDVGQAGFGATAMEARWLDDPWVPGPCRIWMRPRLELLPGRPLSAMSRAAAVADFGNGVSATLPFDRFLFINADLVLHLQREPRGEWVGLDARTILHPGGTALSESVVHDERGPIGRAFQTLVVAAR